MPELEAVAALTHVAEARDLPVLLIGALAREIVFDRQHDGKPYRATRDIDMGVRVSSWEDYQAFVDALIDVGFTRMAEHKLRYKDGTELDLLPFGGVVDENNKLTWLGGDRVISMDGFESADAHGELRNVAGVQIRVINLPGLITLKLFAFRERGANLRSKDLGDLTYILSNASSALIERIYEELSTALIEALDYQQLGPYLLGHDVANTVRRDEADELVSIVNDHILSKPDYALLSRAARPANIEDSIAVFEAFRRGLEEGRI